MPFIRAAGLSRSFSAGPVRVQALQGLDLELEQGELVVLLGPSGSGKTTLLNLLGGLDRPDEGCLEVGGQDLAQLDERGLQRYRRESVGIVFQFFNLLANLTARENLELVGADAPARLASVGLSQRADSFPHQLSGGEQQRLAVARALAQEPSLLLADEPTGNLDSANAREVLKLLHQAHRQGRCVILSTHNPELARCGTRQIGLKDGRLSFDRVNPEPLDPEQLAW